jgi:hypothetical protein
MKAKYNEREGVWEFDGSVEEMVAAMKGGLSQGGAQERQARKSESGVPVPTAPIQKNVRKRRRGHPSNDRKPWTKTDDVRIVSGLAQCTKRKQVHKLYKRLAKEFKRTFDAVAQRAGVIGATRKKNKPVVAFVSPTVAPAPVKKVKNAFGVRSPWTGRGVLWTDAEKQRIKEVFSTATDSIAAYDILVKELKRTRGAIQQKAFVLGVVKKQSRSALKQRKKKLPVATPPVAPAKEVPMPELAEVKTDTRILEQILVQMVKTNGSLSFASAAYALGIEDARAWKRFTEEFLLNADKVAEYLGVKNKFNVKSLGGSEKAICYGG